MENTKQIEIITHVHLDYIIKIILYNQFQQKQKEKLK